MWDSADEQLQQLRDDLRAADEQFERGEFTEYDNDSLNVFFETLRRRNDELKESSD